MARPAKVRAAELVEDYDLYPRSRVDDVHVRDLLEAMRAGHKPPPVVADRESKRLTDGWHRRRATLRLFGPDAIIEVIWRDYESDLEAFEDAVALNSDHGRKLTRWDHARIVIRYQQLGGDRLALAPIIRRDVDYLRRKVHVAITRVNGGTEPVALKRGHYHLEGTTLTEPQVAANERASGWTAAFHARQLISDIKAEMVEFTDATCGALVELRELLCALDLESDGCLDGQTEAA